MGVTEIDNILMILGVCLSMSEKEKEIITREMMRGFNDKANEANSIVTGGQSVKNPFPMIGGTAISTVLKEKVIFPNNAKVGDIIILTKPLGTQVTVNLLQWRNEDNNLWQKCKEYITEEEVFEINRIAIKSMSRLNKVGAELMNKYRVGACTDVTGFGITGHCQNLAIAQKEKLKFVIEMLPVLYKTDVIDKNAFDFGLCEGYSAETSGGLLVIIDKADSEAYVKEMQERGQWAWIIGYVTEGERTVEIPSNVKIEHVREENRTKF